jgi:nucleoid-associated protein YgaU
MATSSKKITNTPAASTTLTKKTVAKKVVAATQTNNTATLKTTATPVKKLTAASTMKAAPTPTKKVSAPKTEIPTSKPAATAKSAPQKSVKENTITHEDRYHMISTAAYFRAEQRGFAGGYEMEDWISGEAQIGAMLNA